MLCRGAAGTTSRGEDTLSACASAPVVTGGGGGGRGGGVADIDDLKLDRGAVRAEADHVAVPQQRLTGDALSIHERAVAAAQILQEEPFGLADEGGVTG
ncbi:MAG TPA: hypothetical protein VGU74_00335 [Gemmatimonadales bacterium]|nr:hypothetical protein [Gemmatimonadales bacterium]